MKTCISGRGVPLAFALMAGAAHGQCWQPVWSSEFATMSQGLANGPMTLAVFDADGPGPEAPALFVGGSFTSAGGQPIARLAKRYRGQWSSVGTFNGNGVRGLGVHDFDGDGPEPPELVAVGDFTTINGEAIRGVARWNGVEWKSIGAGLSVLPGGTSTVVSWDHDGLASTPRRLVISGGFESPSPGWTASIMMWDGAAWTEIPGSALAIAVYDEDGDGPQPERLFQAVDWIPGLYRWVNGGREVVGDGLRSALHTCVALRVIDEDGPGPARPVLYAGGYFTMAGQVSAIGVARWNGQEWSSVGGGIGAQVEDIIAVDFTQGQGAPTIFATGWGNGISGVWQYNRNGAAWDLVGSSQASYGITVYHRLASVPDGLNGRPTVYYLSPTLRFINGLPSVNIGRLMCTCRANCDESTAPPYLTANDFQCFVKKFASGHPYANCDGSTGSPVLTANDFQCFLNAYASGCE
ncbi:MAG: hypothetical protein KF678_10900 [Phycisphaeraceae bacterium]|nr:hypothetical protein [Phycisphaeraceae bacterium]